MKNYTFVILSIFLFQQGFAQTEKLIQGTILCEELPAQGIEVANFTSKKTTISTINGTFSISSKAGDILIFISKNYYYKELILETAVFEKNNLTISLIRKPEQLDEVVVTKIKFPHIGVNQGVSDDMKLEKEAYAPKTIGVYDGKMANGPDLMRIGAMIIGLFVTPKEKSNTKVSLIKFKELVSSTCNEDFFVKKLHLEPDEIALFIEFCEVDPKSKMILDNNNALTVMDFLFDKNAEFKKLISVKKPEIIETTK